MSVVLVPSAGPDDWRQFLAKPDLHWARGFSARTLAYAWEAADGWLPEVGAIMNAALAPTTLELAIPERKTPIPGGRRESQSDVFVLGRHAGGLVAGTIEGKVDEAFGPTVAEQMRDPSPGKVERMAYLCRWLAIDTCPDDVHYQLLHRTVAALIEADRFAATHAAMIVHSFSPTARWFDAFERFVKLFGVKADIGVPALISIPDGPPLILGWACGDQRYRDA